MNKLVSVIVPIYKVEDCLDKCIQSIINQTYKSLEIILVDDGSPDTCPQICDKWANLDNRIKVIHKENGGLSDARNFGIRKAGGEFICFVDSDDIIDSHYVEYLYNALTRTESDIAICNFEKFENDIEITAINNESENVQIFNKKELLNKLFEKNNIHFITAWSKLYKKELFNDLEFDKGKLHEDEFLVHKIFDICAKAVYVPLALYKYFERQGSIMKSKVFTERNLDAYYSILSRYEYFKGTEFENDALIQLLDSITHLYFIAKSRKADYKIIKFLKYKYKEFFKLNKQKSLKHFLCRYFMDILYLIRKIFKNEDTK